MKNLAFTGSLLLIISTLLFYFTTNFEIEEIKLSHFMGIMGGIGIGLIIGGIVGYRSKSLSIKREQKDRERQQLQEDKIALEEQAAVLAEKPYNHP